MSRSADALLRPGVLDLPQSDRMLKPCKAKLVLSKSFQPGSESYVRQQALLYMPWRLEPGSESYVRQQALLYMPWRLEVAQVEVEVEIDALAFYEAQRQVIRHNKALYRANINMPH
ncbi:unnamed protein product [Allacma fusca]|uniref:Uncharacterized protein n=1 Tax=Allacma fusca TaxID=39272 RepID=A0A8J2JMQ3_9HEXA|nr:unnamed protein product [Allacma fusca]